MSIIVLNDVHIPDEVIAASARGKQIRLNSRVQKDNGSEDINVIWTRTLRQYEIGIVPMLASQWQKIEAVHEITEGGAYGCLLTDPKDSVVTASTGRMALVSGSIYQLTKRYTAAGSTRHKDRIITRPAVAGFVAAYDGGAITGTLDADTGRITLASPVADVTLLSWSGSFFVPVHFMEDSIDWDVVRPGPETSSLLLAGNSIVLQEIRE